MTQNNRNHQKLLKLQRRIFRSLQAEAKLLLGETPHSIRKYEKECNRDFSVKKNFFHVIQKAQLIESVRTTDVTFIADFHTFDQAQRTALRIMREAIHPNELWYIGLEMISSEFQNSLDDFQNGKISLETFQKLISYNHEWGFPWNNYAPIFDWAKKNRIRLIALNRPKQISRIEEREDLNERDRWAAGIITDLFQDQKPKMIVLYGELHIGRCHLPKQLQKISKHFLKAPLSSISIHQNNDAVFWKLAEKHQEMNTEVIQLKTNVYCIFSGTPWAKLQSLVNWAEGEFKWEAEEFKDDLEELDYLSIIQTYGNTISEFLGINAPNYETITVCTIDQMDSLRSVLSSGAFTKEELKLIEFHVHYHHRIFIPRLSIVYLGVPTLNGAAEMAAIHLLRSFTRSKSIMHPSINDFFRLTLEFTFGFFGSLILNPRRKCQLPQDHFKRIQDLKKGRRARYPQELTAREIALFFLAEPKLGSKQLQIKKLTPGIIMGARYLGQVIGKKLHQATLDEKLDIKQIHSIFCLESNSIKMNHQERFEALFNQVSTIPIHFHF